MSKTKLEKIQISDHSFKIKGGFTIVELVVSVAVFAILAAGVLAAFAALSKTVKVAREKTVISSLAVNHLEIVKNMPYSQVGTINGNPAGTLPDFANAATTTIEAVLYKIYYEVTFVDDPADGTFPTDPNGADYRQVKINVLNTNTGKVTNFVTNIIPKGLEGTSNAGALRIKVFNAIGQPVTGANIHIEYPATSPTMILDRQSDSIGQWIEVGLPPAVNGYRIVVTKPGYSTDRTFPITVENPNPTKPDATIVVGQVTEVSFAIDLLANLTIKTLDKFCQNLSGIGVNVKGAKLIGINPNVYKFDQNHTSSGGQIVFSGIEWDTYTPTLLTGQSYIIYGTSPIQKIDVLPGSSQTFSMILGTNTTANSLLVIVKNASSSTALEGANVHLRKGGSVPQDYYGITGGSVWVQNDWTAGPGQEMWATSSPDRYYQDDGNIDVNSVPTGVRLKKISGRYVLSGWLESSTFDTGTSATNFTTLTWEPTSQTTGTELKLQLATSNNLEGPWNYLGSDGTSGTFYTVSGNNISPAHDNQRYVRYKAFLSTTDDKHTPILTTLKINYVSGCFTPGQVIFTDLTSGNNYDLDVSLAGYQTVILNSITIDGNNTIEILMSP